MTTFSIPDMSCGHCKAAVEAAVRKLDPTASIKVDLAARRAEIETAQSAAAVIATLDAVGFPAKTL